MAIKKTMASALISGIIFTTGMVFGADLTKDNMFHVEQFEVTVYEDYSMTGEPVTGEGEGIAFDNELVWQYIEGQRIRTGDTVTVYWLEQHAENSDWANIANIEKEGK